MSQRIGLFIIGCFFVSTYLIVAPVNSTEWECGERSNLPLDGKNYCAAGDFRLAEKAQRKILNSVLGKHQAMYDDISALNNAQRAYEQYRDYQCAAENAHAQEEPYYPMIIAQCKTRFTNLRIKELGRMKSQTP